MRSSDIDEGDETNNEQRLNVIITPNQDDDSGTEGSSIQISGTASTIATIGIIILLVGLYALFAPASNQKDRMSKYHFAHSMSHNSMIGVYIHNLK